MLGYLLTEFPSLVGILNVEGDKNANLIYESHEDMYKQILDLQFKFFREEMSLTSKSPRTKYDSDEEAFN